MRYGYLAHHGVKGQKWGIRRYQNPDGSLTAAGKRRYYDKDGNEKYVYPVVTGERIGIGNMSFSTGNIFHEHGRKMTLKKADQYLQKEMDKGNISDVFKDGSEEFVRLTSKGAKKINALGKLKGDARSKEGGQLMSDYYIQMNKGFGKDLTDRALKYLKLVTLSGAAVGGAYLYSKHSK